MAKYNLLKGTQAGYNAIAQKDANSIYFCTDTGNIYVGVNPMFDNQVVKSAALKNSGKVLVLTKRDGTTSEVDLESIINGGAIVLTGYTKPSTTGPIASTDTVNQALGKLEKKMDGVIADALSEVEAGNGIGVSEKASNKQTISVKVKPGEKAIVASSDGVSTVLKIQHDSTNRKIQLLGIDDAVISEFSSEAFVKDGILYDQIMATPSGTSLEVTFPKGDKHTFTGLNSGHPYLFLEFNDGLGTQTSKSFASCDMHGLVDIYTAGDGLQLGTGVDDHKFSVKLASSTNGLIVDGTSKGLKMNLASESANGALSSEDYKKIQDNEACLTWGAF